jgi:hypothetical protein
MNKVIVTYSASNANDETFDPATADVLEGGVLWIKEGTTDPTVYFIARGVWKTATEQKRGA